MNATRAFQEQGVNPTRDPGVNQEQVQQGGQYTVDYADWDVPFMQALLDTEGLLATFSGHDHWNDWCVQLFRDSGTSVCLNPQLTEYRCFKWNGTIGERPDCAVPFESKISRIRARDLGHEYDFGLPVFAAVLFSVFIVFLRLIR